MAINEAYSYKNWAGQTFVHEPKQAFWKSEIVGANFFQFNTPYTSVFPPDAIEIEFIDCNLDNCVLPPGAILTRSTNLHIKSVGGVDCIVNQSLEKEDTLGHYLSIAFWRDV